MPNKPNKIIRKPEMKGKELEATIRDWLLYGMEKAYEKTAKAILKIVKQALVSQKSALIKEHKENLKWELEMNTTRCHSMCEQDIEKELKSQKSALIKEVEGMKREEGQDIITATDIKLESFKEGYNQALSDINHLLK